MHLLLKYKADPNYKIDSSFENKDDFYIEASSPLIRASGFDLNMVKLLIRHGADIHGRVDDVSPFAKAVSSSQFEIIDYYIDSLGVDVSERMRTVVRPSDNEKITYYIQDYIHAFMNYRLGSDSDKLKQALIHKLEGKGVKFDGYVYKLK